MFQNGKRGWQNVARLALLAMVLGPVLAACGGGTGASIKRAAFSSKEFGVSVSPRVTNNPHPPRGGGRHLLGKPYTVRSTVYTPADQPDYIAQGTASWYGADFHGRRTANGEIFSANAITGAHPTLPLPCYVRVTNLDNGRSILVRLNDRGPYMHGRVVDLSYTAAKLLGYVNKGVGNVQVQYVAPAPLNGDDTRMLMASLNHLTKMEQGTTRYAYTEPTTAPQPVDLPEMRPAMQAGSVGTYSSDDLAEDFLSLFSYSDAEAEVFSAHAAVDAMAGRSTALADWVAVTDEDALKIKLELGTFADADGAVGIAEAFALLGAVDEDQVEHGGRAATRLTLTQLKPGVARTDVLALARELGLNDLVLY